MQGRKKNPRRLRTGGGWQVRLLYPLRRKASHAQYDYYKRRCRDGTEAMRCECGYH